MTKKCKNNIKQDVLNKYNIATTKGKLNVFLEKFIPNNNDIHNLYMILDVNQLGSSLH